MRYKGYFAALAVLMVTALAPPAAAADPPGRESPPDETSVTPPNPPSGDIAVTGAGDATGFHLLVADKANPDRWTELASLSEPLWETDTWIGQWCVTGDGEKAVVVYAPREFSNAAASMYGGGFSAVVDLASGEVTKLATRSTLAYYSPGCGTGDTAALSSMEAGAGESVTRTHISLIDAGEAKTSWTTSVDGQATSLTPAGDGVVGAIGNQLTAITEHGETTPLAGYDGVPFDISADADGGIGFSVATENETIVLRHHKKKTVEVARAAKGAVNLQRGVNGSLYVVGVGASKKAVRGTTPSSWRMIDAPAGRAVSTHGGLLVASSKATRGKDATVPELAAQADANTRSILVTAQLVGGSEISSFAEPTRNPAGAELSPSLVTSDSPKARSFGTTADYSDVTWDPDRTCALPRNDPDYQVYQPTADQVEWAANLAVQDKLTFYRAANWNNLGLPTFSPQGQFPSRHVRVPAQILLGILAQESNQWQASPHTADGYAGNHHQGGFYGLPLYDGDSTNDWDINWAKSDCGYGIGQITTGMRKEDTDVVFTSLQQKTVQMDYATNIAAAHQILQDKWIQTRDAGLTVNGGDPAYMENWWFALWAYNTGFYPKDTANPSAPWGVGWLNNPANPIYLPDRGVFLKTLLPGQGSTYDNAKTPNLWSYPERVIGWGATSQIKYDFNTETYVDSYRTAEYSSGVAAAQPSLTLFCVDSVNSCQPGTKHYETGCNPNTDAQPLPPDCTPPGPCARGDLKCWWHGPVSYINCAQSCGRESLKYTSVDPRPYAPDLPGFEPECSAADLPAGALIIDDVKDGPIGPNGCGSSGRPRGGVFTMKFASDGSGKYPAKIDLHQIGGGFGGHFWFSKTHRTGIDAKFQMTGSWTLSTRLDKWTQIYVHVPKTHAHTQQAHYKIYGTKDGVRDRYIPTARRDNDWISLGTYKFDPNQEQKITLSNMTEDGVWLDDIAWDAVAVVPLAQKPRDMVVAMGDSYGSGEGAGDYYTETNRGYSGSQWQWNACHRSKNSWSRQVTLPGTSATVGANSDMHSPNLDFQFVSCSGATTEQLGLHPQYWQQSLIPGTDPGQRDSVMSGQFGEFPQLESGVLSADTTLVLLSVGGNDARFAHYMEMCAVNHWCTPDDATTEELWTNIRADLEQASRNTAAAIARIRFKAPNAEIVLMGYPRIFFEDPSINCPTSASTPGFTPDEAKLFNRAADWFDITQNSAAASAGVKVTYQDTLGPFTGHGLCGPNLAYLHGVEFGSSGDGDVTGAIAPSRESFHPNPYGVTAYVGALQQHLTDIHYGS